MTDFLFEIKKVLIYQKGTWFILLLILLKILSLAILDNGVDLRLETDKEEYLFYLEHVKGALTEENESFLRDESEKIAFAKVKLENQYSDYYDGVLYNQVMPEEELDSLSKPFEEQIEKEKGFQLIYDQYMYIRENPDNRYFLYTNGWNALLAHERLDLPMFFLLLLLIAPMFCNEYESKMDIILLSSKKGRVTLVLKKILLAFFMAALLSLLFSLIEYIYFNFQYGLSDGHYPIQSLEYFHSSLKNVSLYEAFIRVSVYRLFGCLCFSVLIMFMSVCTKKTILTLFISTASILLPYFGLTARWIQYLLPLPLGFMLGSGFFRGDEITDSADAIEPKAVFRAISDTEFTIMAVTLTLIALAMILLMTKKYINFQSIRREIQSIRRKAGESMKRMMTLFVIIVSTLLSGCGKKDEMNENSRIFNMQINRISSENQDAVFYIREKNQIIAQDKESGDRYDAVKNPFGSFFNIGTVFYVYDNNLYYIRNEETYTQAGALQDSSSIVEIDWDTYDERTIYELDTRIKKDAFLGTVKSDAGSFSSIRSFFLDDKYIYLVMSSPTGDTLNKVDRQTGKAEIILESSKNIDRLAFDGKYIYYINPRFQVVRLDVETKESFIIPHVVTRYMILKDNQLLFLNPRDNGRIYAMDLNDFSLRKITEDAAYTFHYDDSYIYYANEDDNKYLYRIDFEGKNNQKAAEVVSYSIAVFQNHGELHVLSDKGTYVVDKETFEVNILE